MKLCAGVTRLVLLVGPVAVKVPNPRWGMIHLVRGMLANLYERERWAKSRHPMLTPTYVCLPFGLLAVQRRVPISVPGRLMREEVDRLPFIGYDNNGHNAGLLRGKLVLFDYGDCGVYLVVR